MGTRAIRRRRPSIPRSGTLPRFTLSLIIPARNEATGLRIVLSECIPGFIDEIIVVDGHSTDGTRETVREVCPGALVVAQTGRGKGDAIKLGLSLARGDIVVTIDGDGSHRLSDIRPMVEKLVLGFDFVKGSRTLPGAGSEDLTVVRSAGNRALTAVARLLYGAHWTDITYGINAYWRHIMMDATDLSDGFQFEIQAAIRAARGGLAIAEVPCFERARVGGVSKLSPFSDGFRILRTIIGEAAPRRRVRFRAMADIYLLDSHEQTLRGGGQGTVAAVLEHKRGLPSEPVEFGVEDVLTADAKTASSSRASTTTDPLARVAPGRLRREGSRSAAEPIAARERSRTLSDST